MNHCDNVIYIYVNLPLTQTICACLKEIGYTREKITSVPSESQTPESQAKFDDLMNYISDIDVHSLHFFMNHQLIKLVENGNMQVKKLANMLLKFSHMLQMKVLQSMYCMVYVVWTILVFRRTLIRTRTTETHLFC